MAERVRLESEYSRKIIRGSNPLASAKRNACHPADDQPKAEKACMVVRSSRVRIPVPPQRNKLLAI